MSRIVLSLLWVVCAVFAGCSSGGSGRAAGPSRPQPRAERVGGGVAFMGRDLPLEQVLAQARASGRPAMLYFATSWCGFCRLFDEQTLSDPGVAAHMAGYTNVRYDAESPTGRALAARYGVLGFPTLVRVDAAGAKQGFFEGYDPPADFVRRIPRP